MENTTVKKVDWIARIHELGKDFEKRALHHDGEGTFVFDNYAQLKEHNFFSAAIPKVLGGGGVSHAEMCEIIRVIAHYCSSTALAFSMHQHIIAAANWKLKHQNVGADMLENVAANELVLISTGARDWLGSNGEIKKTEGGYLLNAKKHFASQSIGGDVAVTSATYNHPSEGWQVCHFSVPMTANGVSVADDWDVMGMRATGSQTIVFNEVFIPESSIVLARPKSEFHPVWNVVLTVALPLIMSAYYGIAEKAFEIGLKKGRKYGRNEDQMPYRIGKINNALLSARVQWQAMVALCNNFDFQPSEKNTMDMLSYKTNVGDQAKVVVAESMDAIGGQSFYRSNGLERLFRDVQASSFHPLPKWEQYKFTGERLLKK
jgi:alkylation response protein AidB-like acyl-CoA dehydrogenase